MKKTNIVLSIIGIFCIATVSSLVTAMVLTNQNFYQRFSDDPMITLIEECGGTYENGELLLPDGSLTCIRDFTTGSSCLMYAETDILVNGQEAKLFRLECKEGR